MSDPSNDSAANPLVTKQAIIVLREELEYFSITKPGEKAQTDIKTGIPNEELRELKRNCGKALAERKTIFTALQRNVSKENNMAEQHLIDMLCMRCVSLSLWLSCSVYARLVGIPADTLAADSTETINGDSERASPTETSFRPWPSSSSRLVSSTLAIPAQTRTPRAP